MPKRKSSQSSNSETAEIDRNFSLSKMQKRTRSTVEKQREHWRKRSQNWYQDPENKEKKRKQSKLYQQRQRETLNFLKIENARLKRQLEFYKSFVNQLLEQHQLIPYPKDVEVEFNSMVNQNDDEQR